MKRNLIKIGAGFGLLAVSAVAFAANADCCTSIECCIQMLACCF